MKKDLTEMVFILDMSGSMGGLEDDTVGGFNSMLERRRADGGEAYVTTVLFDDIQEVIHDRVPISRVPKLTRDVYCPRGSTALFDAVGITVRHIKRLRKEMPKDERPEHTVVVITTDGMENASREFTRSQIKRMIEKQKGKGWEFVFMAANIDAGETAEEIGIDRDFAVDMIPDGAGIQQMFCAVSNLVAAPRAARMSKAWRADIDSDFAKRRGK